jgi:type VI secretion system protein ImpG
MFFELSGLAERLPLDESNTLDLYFYLGGSDVELEHHVSASTFQLGCTPAANLFAHRADPIKLKHTATEYEVVPDARRPAGYEIYSVDEVVATDSSGNSETYLPLYGASHQNRGNDNPAFWFSTRRHAKLGYGQRDDATDVFLSLVDLDFNPNNPDDRTLLLRTTCSNRDLPGKLPFSLEEPRLQAVDSAPPCSRIQCITQPTAAVRASMRNNSRWKLISHLSLNHLSITGGDDATEALKEILRLYDFRDLTINRAQIDSINHIHSKAVSAALNVDGRNTLCRGIEVDIELDGLQMTGSSSYLFASVLEHFFALYSSINSFTRVLVRLKNKEGYLKKCPPRAGEKILL